MGGQILRFSQPLTSRLRHAARQDGFNCSSLPAGLGGNGEFGRKLEGEIIQNEVSLGGSPTMNVTLVHFIDIRLPLSSCIMISFPPITTYEYSNKNSQNPVLLARQCPSYSHLMGSKCCQGGKVSRSHLMAFVRTLNIYPTKKNMFIMLLSR